jgi:hypothetical protein
MSVQSNVPVAHACSVSTRCDAQLKQDIEEFWLEAVVLGAIEIAVGFPGSWWYGN